MKQIAYDMIRKGVETADPERLINENIELDNNKIKISNKEFNKNEYSKILLFGIGKAAVSMASGLNKLDPDDGLIITKEGKVFEGHYCPVPVRKVSHPYPEQKNIEVSEEIIDKIEGLENALIIFLISGGGSALFLSPVESISISEMNELNKLLVKSGANIHQINSVRKHVSRVKGGRFAELCEEKADLISLIISDVVGDDLSVIASGPTYPDDSTFKDAKKALKDFDLWDKISKNIRNHIEKGTRSKMKETPNSVKTYNFLIGNNMTALNGAKEVAKKNGLNPLILTSQNQGEAREVAKPYIGMAKEVQDTGNPIEPPAALIFGGEMTVTFESMDSESGKGGPNREFVLASAIEIVDRENIVVASVDSDGIDGVEKAGAIADTNSIKRSNLNAKDFLKSHSSQDFFDSIDDSIEFDSRTNVNDISVIIIDEKK
ncbi:MAG: glycerate kinase [Thermoplasmata archaeon]